MAHLLMVEFPGGNDFGVMEDALALGHQVSLCTGELAHYERLGEDTARLLHQLRHRIEVPGFAAANVVARLEAVHAQNPFDALICMVDIRIPACAEIAAALGLPFLAPAAAVRLRDKAAVRARLAQAGIAQPRFCQIHAATELAAAIADVSYPLIVKPSDGYASQNIFRLDGPGDLDAVRAGLEALFDQPADYGLGVRSSNAFCVEQCLAGTLVGCDVFRDGRESRLLGVNEKQMFAPPSFAIRGSCFPSERVDVAAAAAYAEAVLDAVGFDFGAAHVEMMLTDEGPRLVEINPRLVSAQIPYQMAYALGRSVYVDLIELHLGRPLADMAPFERRAFSATRWFTAERSGRFDDLLLPQEIPTYIQRIVILKSSGDPVCPPLANADRLGYVIATGASEAEAEDRAQAFVDRADVRVRQSDDESLEVESA